MLKQHTSESSLNWHGLTWIGGTFESDTGGTFHSDMPGTFQSDMSGTFGPLLSDILERRNYLVEKLVTTPQEVLNEMPSSIGPQFQGEWALYSCSMLSASLVNISKLYPETKAENIKYIDKLITLVSGEKFSDNVLIIKHQ